MKRKLLSLLLVMAMGMTLLVGCGGSDDGSKDDGDTNISQDADKGQKEEDTTKKDTEEQSPGFVGEEVTYTYGDVKVRVVYDEDVIRVITASDELALKLGLVDKYYSEYFYMEKFTPQSFVERTKTALDTKAAAPETTKLNSTPEDKEGTGNVETTVYNMTKSYTNTSVGELEKIDVASGMDVYRLEEKYTLTTSYEKISGPAEDRETEVFDSHEYYYFIDLGNGYILTLMSFQVDANTLDRELKTDALERMLNAIYIEAVAE